MPIHLEEYNYFLPNERIAQAPAFPRDSAGLFVYNTQTDTVDFDIFRNIDQYLPHNSHLVMNDTEVVPARVFLRSETGMTHELLLMMNDVRPTSRTIPAMAREKIAVGATLYFQSGAFFTVQENHEKYFQLLPNIPIPEIFTLLRSEGTTPIPPYITDSPLDEQALRKDYQSILAKYPASVAAPTASLHFTPEVFSRLTNIGIQKSTITLHIGAGTFAPLTDENFSTKSLFPEYFCISETSSSAINKAIAEGFPIIPVGTTATRSIESAATLEQFGSWKILPTAKETTLFLYPPYDFRVTNHLLTNFHVPCSSLLLLVDAFLQHRRAPRRILDLYSLAIKEEFRFYSFGDAMLIL